MRVYRRLGPCVWALALTAELLFAPVPAPAAARQSESADPVHKFIRHYELATVDAGAASKSGESETAFAIDSPSHHFELRLAPHDVRSRRSRAVETLEDGTRRERPRVEAHTFAGTALNYPGSVARFTMDGDEVVGMIRTDEETYFVEPLSRYSLAGGPTDYVLYGLSDLNPEALSGACATTEASRVLEEAARVGELAKGAAAVDQYRVVEIATEADDEYVAALGGAAAANAEILGIVNQVEGIYRAELGIAFDVVLQHTYSGRDPYTATADPGELLEEFRGAWNATMTGVRRDLAHLWTGRDLDGTTVGLAYVGTVCASPSYSYGLSQRLSSAPAKYVLTAHELGHNFNACHADDDCNSSPAACGNTIMQSMVGSGFTFCPFSREQIRSFLAANASCLALAKTGLAAPSDLTAQVASATSATLSWRDATDGETGFVIYAKAPGKRWRRIGTTAPNATSYTVTGLLAGTSYRLRVRAANGIAVSPWSNRVKATTLD